MSCVKRFFYVFVLCFLGFNTLSATIKKAVVNFDSVRSISAEFVDSAPKYINGVHGDLMELNWQEEFKVDGQPDSESWIRVPRAGSDWNNTASELEELAVVQNDNLELHGIENPDTSSDSSPYLTGAIWSKGKVNLSAGQVQIRARMDSAQGAWPALWMLGAEGGWPSNGEFDLLEHLNFDGFVHQTVHSNYTVYGETPNNPAKTKTVQVDVGEYNVYGVEWDNSSVNFTVNGVTTLVYPRQPEKGADQYPWVDNEMYIILSMQIGGSWVGSATDPSQYPIKMDVDWVRYYKKVTISPEVTKICVDVAKSSSGDGTSWDSAINNLPDAIAVANEGMEIWVKGGTYNVVSTINIDKSVKIYGGFAGTETEISQRALDSVNSWDFSNKTKFTGNRTHFNITADNVVLDGIWSWGSSDGTSGYSADYGGIISSGNNVKISNSIVQGHWPWFQGSSGGGIHLSVGSATIDSCLVYKNRCKNGGGAGIRISGGTHVVKNSQIQENFSDEAADTYGAGIKVDGGSHHQILESSIIGNTLSGNATGFGGGIYTASPITISGCDISGNSSNSTAEAGGGIHNTATGTLVENCLVANNSGSGIHVTADSAVLNCTIVKNRALADGSGGVTASGAYIAIRDSILWGNEKGGSNGGQLGQVGSGTTTANNNNTNCFIDNTIKFCAMQPSGTGTVNAEKCAWINGVLGGDGTRIECASNVTLTFTNPSTTAGASGYLATADWSFSSDSLMADTNYGVSLSEMTVNISGAQTIPVFYKGVDKQPLFRVKIDTSAVSVLDKLTSLVFDLSGTTDIDDIISAKLYKTSVPYFSPNTWDNKGAFTIADGSIADGKISFNIDETMIDGSRYYWLAVDISSDATGKNHLDAKLESVQIGSEVYDAKIINSSPAGSVEIFHHKHRISPYYRVDNLLRWYPGRLTPAHFNVITDVIIFNVRPNSDGSINFPDGSWKSEYDSSDADGKFYFNEAVVKLKELRGSADVELLLGVVTGEFPAVAADPQLTDTFATNLVDYAVEVGLDGIDIDWEYPTSEQQWIDFANFVSVLREKMFEHGLTLGCAINPNWQQPKTYFLDQFDVVNSMSYDRGAGTGGNHSPYGGENDTWTGSHVGDYYWLTSTMGVPKEKVVMGIPMYTCPHQNSDGGNVDWGGVQRGYGNILDWKPNLLPHVNSIYPSPVDGKYHSFNGKDLLQKKVADMKAKGYGGLMIWAFDTDTDFENPRAAMRAISQMFSPKVPFSLVFPKNGQEGISSTETINLQIDFYEAVTVQSGARAVIYSGTTKNIDLSKSDAYEVYQRGNEIVAEIGFDQNSLTRNGTKLTVSVPAFTLEAGKKYWVKIERDAIKYIAKDELWTGCLHEDYWNFSTNYLVNPNFNGTSSTEVFNGWKKSGSMWGTSYGATTGITGRTTVYSGDPTATLSQITRKRIKAHDEVSLIAELRRDNNGYRDKTVKMELIAVADDGSEAVISSATTPANGTYYRVLTHVIDENSPHIGKLLKVLVGNTSNNVWINFYSVDISVDNSFIPSIGVKVSQKGNEISWTVPFETGIYEFQIVDADGNILWRDVPRGDLTYTKVIGSGEYLALVVICENDLRQTFIPSSDSYATIYYDLKEGWNLIAMPGENSDISGFEHIILGGFWGWNGDSYEIIDTPVKNQAVWVYAPTANKVIVTAEKVEAELNLELGWNMVGSTENVELPTDAHTVYGWNGVYREIWGQNSILLQGVGYWIFKNN